MDKLQELAISRSDLEKKLHLLTDMSPVWGEGSVFSRVMLVGEAPGEQETREGRPFVGKAGKNLDAFLELINLERSGLYVTNTVKIRPCVMNPKTGRYRNRPPSTEEIRICAQHLADEIRIVSPKWIVTLGNTSLRAVTGDTNAVIGEMHGKPYMLENGSVLFPLYHPASIIYNRSLETVYRNDVLAFKEML